MSIVQILYVDDKGETYTSKSIMEDLSADKVVSPR